MNTDIVIFVESDPDMRAVSCRHDGSPSWSRDSTVFFHWKVDDGWWSIFRTEISNFSDLVFRSSAPNSFHSGWGPLLHSGGVP
ncbi:hypothetical protein LINPERHAP2_LOCUS5646 [Linum perenne]